MITARELSVLLLGTTRGPWRYDDTMNEVYSAVGDVVVIRDGGAQFRDDLPLIALAPALAARVIELEAALEARK